MQICTIIPLLLVTVACTSVQTRSYSITENSYGPVQLGMSVSQVASFLQDYESDEEVYGEGHGCYYISNADESNRVYFMIVDDRVARFDVTAESLGIKTDRSIGVGSHKQEILAAYGDVSVSEHPYLGAAGEYLEVSLDNGNGLIFETHQDRVSSYRLGSYPSVAYIEGCL